MSEPDVTKAKLIKKQMHKLRHYALKYEGTTYIDLCGINYA